MATWQLSPESEVSCCTISQHPKMWFASASALQSRRLMSEVTPIHNSAAAWCEISFFKLLPTQTQSRPNRGVTLQRTDKKFKRVLLAYIYWEGVIRSADNKIKSLRVCFPFLRAWTDWLAGIPSCYLCFRAQSLSIIRRCSRNCVTQGSINYLSECIMTNTR